MANRFELEWRVIGDGNFDQCTVLYTHVVYQPTLKIGTTVGAHSAKYFSVGVAVTGTSKQIVTPAGIMQIFSKLYDQEGYN